MLLIGKIEDQPLNSEIQIEDVEDITKYAFPLQQGEEGSIYLQNRQARPCQKGKALIS